MLEEAVAVRAVGKRHVESFGVIERLLHAGAHRVVVVLCLDYRQRKVGLVEEDVVGLLRLSARGHFSTDDDAALRKEQLFEDLGHHVPLGDYRRRDELRKGYEIWAGAMTPLLTAMMR